MKIGFKGEAAMKLGRKDPLLSEATTTPGDRERDSQTLSYTMYVGYAADEFSGEELMKLLAIARESNHGIDVSGILLHCEAAFSRYQVLEGDIDVVGRPYGRICVDKRHINVTRSLSPEQTPPGRDHQTVAGPQDSLLPGSL